MVVLLEGSPISTEELWNSVRVTIEFLVTSLPKALLPWFLSFAGRTSLARVSGVPNIFHLRMMEAPVFLGTFNAAEKFVFFPRAVPQHNHVSGLYGQFLWHFGLVFALTCTVNCGTSYRQVCALANHVQSIEFTTGRLQSSCRNISRMINGNRMHLSSISSLIAKGLNTYVSKVFLFLFLICGKKKKNFVIMGYCA